MNNYIKDLISDKQKPNKKRTPKKTSTRLKTYYAHKPTLKQNGYSRRKKRKTKMEYQNVKLWGELRKHGN